MERRARVRFRRGCRPAGTPITVTGCRTLPAGRVFPLIHALRGDRPAAGQERHSPRPPPLSTAHPCALPGVRHHCGDLRAPALPVAVIKSFWPTCFGCACHRHPIPRSPSPNTVLIPDRHVLPKAVIDASDRFDEPSGPGRLKLLVPGGIPGFWSAQETTPGSARCPNRPLTT